MKKIIISFVNKKQITLFKKLLNYEFNSNPILWESEVNYDNLKCSIEAVNEFFEYGFDITETIEDIVSNIINTIDHNELIKYKIE